jgi:hypothetical protein
MHSIYGFILRAPTDMAGASIKELSQWAFGQYEAEYAYDHADENNWYESICCVSAKGALHPLESPNKFGIYEQLSAMPASSRWKYSVNFSDKLIKSLLYFNLHVEKFEDDRTYLKLIEEAVEGKICPDYLKKCKEILSGDIRPTPTASDVEAAQEMLLWHNQKLETLKNCLLSCQTGYFSRTIASPYDFSCFDLRSETSQSGQSRDVVLWMDIHT